MITIMKSMRYMNLIHTSYTVLPYVTMIKLRVKVIRTPDSISSKSSIKILIPISIVQCLNSLRYRLKLIVRKIVTQVSINKNKLILIGPIQRVVKHISRVGPTKRIELI